MLDSESVGNFSFSGMDMADTSGRNLLRKMPQTAPYPMPPHEQLATTPRHNLADVSVGNSIRFHHMKFEFTLSIAFGKRFLFSPKVLLYPAQIFRGVQIH